MIRSSARGTSSAKSSRMRARSTAGTPGPGPATLRRHAARCPSRRGGRPPSPSTSRPGSCVHGVARAQPAPAAFLAAIIPARRALPSAMRRSVPGGEQLREGLVVDRLIHGDLDALGGLGGRGRRARRAAAGCGGRGRCRGGAAGAAAAASSGSRRGRRARELRRRRGPRARRRRWRRQGWPAAPRRRARPGRDRRCDAAVPRRCGRGPRARPSTTPRPGRTAARSACRGRPMTSTTTTPRSNSSTARLMCRPNGVMGPVAAGFSTGVTEGSIDLLGHGRPGRRAPRAAPRPRRGRRGFGGGSSSRRILATAAAHREALQSRRWDLNPRPTTYEAVALPLSYSGGSRGLYQRSSRCWHPRRIGSAPT